MGKVNFKTFQEKAAVNMQYLEKESVAQNMAIGYTESTAKVMERAESVNMEFVSSLGAVGGVCSTALKMYKGDPSSEDVQYIKEKLGNALVNIAILSKYFSLDFQEVADSAYEGIAVITDTGKIPGTSDE